MLWQSVWVGGGTFCTKTNAGSNTSLQENDGGGMLLPFDPENTGFRINTTTISCMQCENAKFHVSQHTVVDSFKLEQIITP